MPILPTAQPCGGTREPNSRGGTRLYDPSVEEGQQGCPHEVLSVTVVIANSADELSCPLGLLFLKCGKDRLFGLLDVLVCHAAGTSRPIVAQIHSNGVAAAGMLRRRNRDDCE
jgi:hypothetical protein